MFNVCIIRFKSLADDPVNANVSKTQAWILFVGIVGYQSVIGVGVRNKLNEDKYKTCGFKIDGREKIWVYFEGEKEQRFSGQESAASRSEKISCGSVTLKESIPSRVKNY